jgi:hypothetical protein
MTKLRASISVIDTIRNVFIWIFVKWIFQGGELVTALALCETEMNEARLHEKTCRENLGAKLD